MPVDGYLYGYDGSQFTHYGEYRCLDLETGEVAWSVNLGGPGAVIAVGGKLILVTERGAVKVSDPSPMEYRELAAADLPRGGGLYWNSPAFSRGRLYVMSVGGDIYCIDMR